MGLAKDIPISLCRTDPALAVKILRMAENEEGLDQSLYKDANQQTSPTNQMISLQKTRQSPFKVLHDLEKSGRLKAVGE